MSPPGDGEFEMLAGDRLRVETRESSISMSKKVRAFVVNLVLAAVTGPSSWPPVDVVLIDKPTGRTVKTWHEGGEGASLLTTVMNEDLATMTLGDLVEKWDLLLV